MGRATTLAKSTSGAIEPERAPLRVASICTLFPNDAQPHRGIFVARRLEHLSQQADVRLLQPVPWFPLLRRGPECGWAENQNGTRLYRRKMFYLPGVWKSLDGRWLARSILPILERWRDEVGIDLIDAHFGYPEGVGAVLAARRLKLPAFLTLRGNEQVYLKIPSIRRQLLAACESCTGIITVSHSLGETIASAGVDRNKIRVIPNAVDSAEFSPGSREQARRELGLPQSSPVIVSVGQLISGKGHDVLIRAMDQLRGLQPDALLVIVGGASYERHTPRKLQQLVDSLDLNHAVRFIGTQRPENVVRWLRAADLFALCTHREGCCNAVLEALACGLPVVTTHAGDNAHYVDPDRNGYLVARNEPDLVCQSLQAALSRTWEPHTISNGISRDGWNGVARDVLDFFESQLNRAGQGLPQNQDME